MVTVSIYKDNLEIIKDGKNIDFNKNFNNQEKIDKFIEKFESQNVNNNKIIDLYKPLKPEKRGQDLKLTIK